MFVITYHDSEDIHTVTFTDVADFLAQYALEDFVLNDDVIVDELLLDDEAIDFAGTILDLYNEYRPPLSVTYHDLHGKHIIRFDDVDDFLAHYALDDFPLDDDFVIDEVLLDDEVIDFAGTFLDLYDLYKSALTITYHDLEGGVHTATFDGVDDFLAQYVLEDFVLDDELVVDELILNGEPIDFDGTILDLYNLYHPALTITYHDLDGSHTVTYTDVDDFLTQYALDDFILDDDFVVDEVLLDDEPVVFTGTILDLYNLYNG